MLRTVYKGARVASPRTRLALSAGRRRAKCETAQHRAGPGQWSPTRLRALPRFGANSEQGVSREDSERGARRENSAQDYAGELGENVDVLAKGLRGVNLYGCRQRVATNSPAITL